MTKLKEKLNVSTVEELVNISKQNLKLIFGNKTGQILFERSRGVDPSELKLIHVRRSVGTQISWGVRFSEFSQVFKFISDMASEVGKRLQRIGVSGKHITLKILKKNNNFESDTKFMNPGKVKNITRSTSLIISTSDEEKIFLTCKQLFQQMHLQPSDVRGGGIQVDDLTTGRGETKPNLLTRYFVTCEKNNDTTSLGNPNSEIEIKSDKNQSVEGDEDGCHRSGFARCGEDTIVGHENVMKEHGEASLCFFEDSWFEIGDGSEACDHGTDKLFSDNDKTTATTTSAATATATATTTATTTTKIIPNKCCTNDTNFINRKRKNSGNKNKIQKKKKAEELPKGQLTLFQILHTDPK
eukprot:TRINITY_DN7201_c0_g3_i8.p1 TRINITY_DN7201_c0_g3~~TRINITY_DN7201_c0_g3_i8.p1  ORF type:complete len:355 (-),score=108.57 TRINITY_DN7201_c0_g3_i8:145-1209(-)